MASGVAAYTIASAAVRPSAMRASGGKRRAPVALTLVRHDVPDRVVDGELGLPSRQRPERPRVRLAPAELLEAVLVGVLVGHEVDLGSRLRVVDHAPRELDDRDLGRRAD